MSNDDSDGVGEKIKKGFSRISADPVNEEEEKKKFYEREQRNHNLNLVLNREQKTKVFQSQVYEMGGLIQGVKMAFAVCRVYVSDMDDWRFLHQGGMFLVRTVDPNELKLVLVNIDRMSIVWEHKLFEEFKMERTGQHFVVINDESQPKVYGLSFAHLYHGGRDFKKIVDESVLEHCKPVKKEGILSRFVNWAAGGASEVSGAISAPPPPMSSPQTNSQSSSRQSQKDTNWMMGKLEEAGYKKEELVEDEKLRIRCQEYFSAYDNQEEGKKIFESLLNIPSEEEDALSQVDYPELPSDDLDNNIMMKQQQQQPEVPKYQMKNKNDNVFDDDDDDEEENISHQYAPPEEDEENEELMSTQMKYQDEQQKKANLQRGVIFEQQRKLKQLESKLEEHREREKRETQKIGQMKNYIARMESEKNEDLKLSKVKEQLLMTLLYEEHKKKEEKRRMNGVGDQRRRKRRTNRFNINNGLNGPPTFQEDGV